MTASSPRDQRPPQLKTPDFTDRLLMAATLAHKKPPKIRDELRVRGVEISDKALYKVFDGTTKNPKLRLLAGLAAVLGTDVRWFCEADEDGELYAALCARWVRRSENGDAPDTP